MRFGMFLGFLFVNDGSNGERFLHGIQLLAEPVGKMGGAEPAST